MLALIYCIEIYLLNQLCLINSLYWNSSLKSNIRVSTVICYSPYKWHKLLFFLSNTDQHEALHFLSWFWPFRRDWWFLSIQHWISRLPASFLELAVFRVVLIITRYIVWTVASTGPAKEANHSPLLASTQEFWIFTFPPQSLWLFKTIFVFISFIVIMLSG